MLSKNRIILILLLAPMLILFSWFKDGGVHGQGEEGLSFYDVSVGSKLYSLTWREVSAGYYNPVEISKVILFTFLKWLSSLGVPNFLIQAFMDYTIMITGTLSVYFLVVVTLGSRFKSTLLPTTAALFYLLNPFSMSQIWGRGLYMQLFPFALLPLFLLLYILAINRQSLLFLIFALLSSFIFTPAFQHVTYVASLWFLIIIYSLFYLYYNRTKKDIILIIIFFGILFIGWILTQGWWLALYFKSTADVYSSNSGAYRKENLGTFLGVSRDFSLPTIIRLLHEGYFFRDSRYGDIYKSLPFQLISWLIPLVSLFSVKYFKENKYLKFFGIIFIIGLIISLGANFPFGPILTWAFINITPLQVFRNPFEKFGLVLILGYSILFAVGLMHLSKRSSRRLGGFIFVTIIILILGIYSWPIWTGRIISGIDKKIGIIVPAYYVEFRNWIHSQRLEGYRLMMLPIASGEGVVYKWGDRLYNGYPPSEHLIDYPSISSTPRFAYLYDYLHSLRKYLPQMDVAPAISLLGVKYIVDRQDMVMISQAETEQKDHLLDTIYPQLGIENTARTVCQNLTKGQQIERSYWIVCEVPRDQINWKDIKYMHVKVKTNTPSNLEIAIRDEKSNRPRWDGRADDQYSTGSSETEVITASLGAPSEYTDKIDMSDIILVEIIAHPKDKDQTVNSVTLEGIWLDSGKEEKIDEYSFVANFTNLNIYQNNKFTTPPHFGVLQSIVKVDGFKELFEKAHKQRQNVDKLGFLMTEQNSKRDWKKIATSEATVSDIAEVSNTRYHIKVDSEKPFNLILSELFDPNWKVIPGIDKKDLDGSLSNNVKILKKSFLDESDHFVVNGYANLWSIKGENREYAVVFLPQIIKEVGFVVSLSTVVLLLLVASMLIGKKILK